MSNQQYRHCGRKLTPAELVEFLTDQHSAMVDDPIMLWLSMSLEDMADVITRAINSAASEELSSACMDCGGTGMRDSGGFQPWGEAISVPCNCSVLQHTALAAAREFSDGQDAFDDWRQS